MPGRQWHWIAAGTVAAAVVAAVSFSDTSGDSSFRAHPFATVEGFTPQVGAPIVANPTLDATTVEQAAPPPAQSTSVKQTPPPPPPQQPPPPAGPPPVPAPPAKPRVTLSITVPVFFPDCLAAWSSGAAPIGRGEPGYRRELDRDRDGVACER